MIPLFTGAAFVKVEFIIVVVVVIYINELLEVEIPEIQWRSILLTLFIPEPESESESQSDMRVAVMVGDQ